MKWDLRIQGLRAVAVLGVLAFHFFPSAFPRGYLGVDIFFVISGFVITKKILIHNQQPKLLRNFYLDRYKRLAPSLLILFVVTTILILAFTENITDFMREAFFGLLFISNFYYFMNSNYFSISSHNQTFLHLWSLGIEMQFYLFFPLLFTLRKKHQTKIILMILSLASISFFLLTASFYPRLNFYSPFSRFWEFTLGALVVWLQNNRHSQMLLLNFLKHKVTGFISFYGLLMLLLTEWIRLTNQIATLVCCILTALIIYSSFFSVMLINKVSQWIGFYSYEIYLIHWPIVSIYVYQSESSEFSHARFKPLLLIFTFALAAIIGKLSSRLKTTVKIKYVFFSNSVIGSVILIFILVGINENNSQGTLSGELSALQERACVPAVSSSQVSSFCRIIKSSTSNNTVVIWGDSLASAYGRAFAESPAMQDFTVYRISVPACGPFPDLVRTDKSFGSEWCSSSTLEQAILDYIKKLHPTKVVIIARWDLYVRGLYSNGNLVEPKFYTDKNGPANPQTSLRTIPQQINRLISEFSSGKTEVLLFGESPFLDHSPKFYKEAGGVYPKYVEPTEYLKIRTQISEMIKKSIVNSDAKLFVPYQYLCPGDQCQFIVNGGFAFQDDVHISDQMARQLALDSQFNALLSSHYQG